MEDRQAVNLGVSGTLNNNFKLGLNYTDYLNGHIQNKSRDLDNASVTASYTF
jgi:phosphate-selective porin